MGIAGDNRLSSLGEFENVGHRSQGKWFAISWGLTHGDRQSEELVHFGKKILLAFHMKNLTVRIWQGFLAGFAHVQLMFAPGFTMKSGLIHFDTLTSSSKSSDIPGPSWAKPSGNQTW